MQCTQRSCISGSVCNSWATILKATPLRLKCEKYEDLDPFRGCLCHCRLDVPLPTPALSPLQPSCACSHGVDPQLENGKRRRCQTVVARAASRPKNILHTSWLKFAHTHTLACGQEKELALPSKKPKAAKAFGQRTSGKWQAKRRRQ